MKKRQLLILIFTILISIVSVGCSSSNSSSENKSKSESESEIVIEKQVINASVVTKHNQKEIIIYSDTTCFFNLSVSITDEETESSNSYGEFKITGGEQIVLTIDDLAPGFFSDKAIITSVSDVDDPYIYTDNSISKENYKDVDCQILMKYSDKEITIFSDTTCYFDLNMYTTDGEFHSHNDYKKIKVLEGETLTLALNDLAPGFFSDDTIIRHCSSYINTYVEE